MILTEVAGRLDAEFGVATCSENLVEWAVTDDNCALVYPEFLEHKTGLMVQGAAVVREVRTAVFVTDRVVQAMRNTPPSLLFTHHNFDYYEDERGLQPIRSEQIRDLVRYGHSIYVAHAPLDTHPEFGTSQALAAAVGLEVHELFYDYFGMPTALVANTRECDFGDFVAHVGKCLSRPRLDVMECRSKVQRIAVVAGGGDSPDLLQEANSRGCDTIVMGTLVHRWAIPAVQEGHERFLTANKALRLNLVGGSHYGTERPAMFHVQKLFARMGMRSEFCEDDQLLRA